MMEISQPVFVNCGFHKACEVHYNAVDAAYFLLFYIFPSLFKINSAFKSIKALILSRVLTLIFFLVTFTMALMNISEKQYNGRKVHLRS